MMTTQSDPLGGGKRLSGNIADAKVNLVVVDTIPVELKSSYMVWSWLSMCSQPICC